MTFEELLTDVKSCVLEETRRDEPRYLEAVFQTSASGPLTAALVKFFGPPFKPAGVKPTRESDKHSQPYGGVLKEQTLYYLEKEGIAHCAMLWPWNDKRKATLKIARA